MIHLFSRCSRTTSPELKKALPHFELSISPQKAYNLVLAFLEQYEYENIKANADFGDIYSEKKGFEITFLISEVDKKAQILISIYGKNKRGQTYTRLKIVYDEFDEFLEDKGYEIEK
ncbi:MAG: hypothetical protein RBR80_03475 [Bacilli bacterium]|jgi:hypothetical protein|nr:hypothetical protein [Bacilli bacterium]